MPATNKPGRVAGDASLQKTTRAYNNLIDYLNGNKGMMLPALAVVGDLTAGGNLVWKSGTNFTATLDHAATANRIITVQDLAGTMALLGAANVGHLLFVDDTYDIGATGATRPRDLFLARNAVIGGTLTLNGEASAKASESGIVANDLTLIAATFTSFSPACSLSLSPGEWMVQGVFSFTEIGAADVGNFVRGRLNIVSGSATIANTNAHAIGTLTALGCIVQPSRAWRVTVTSTAVIEIQAGKDGGTGGSVCAKDFSTIEAWYQGKP